MSEKRYKITTSKKVFETDNVGPDYLKEENGVFYAKEIKTDNWQQIKKIEKKTSALDKWEIFSDKFFDKLFDLGSYWFWVVFCVSLFFCIVGEALKLKELTIFGIVGMFLIFPMPGCLVWLLISGIIGSFLKDSKYYLEILSDKDINQIIENNKRHNSSTQSSYKNYSSRSYSGGGYSGGGSGGARSGSYSGGSSSGGGGSFGRTSTYVPANDINKALKEFKSEGKDVNALVNNVSDEEREKLFSEYFKDEDKGQYANNKFNQDIAWPARKQTLEKILNEAEYEDNETKDNLSEKINNLGEEISNEDFQATAKEIRTFQERKRAKDNHIKYEGRLSNKDIQAIKEYHGYVCMGCGLDPVEEYGEQMKGILEAHHKIPWANMEEGETRTVEPNDFYILCPNCHRMIHKLKSPDDLDGLKEVLNQNKKSHWWD